MDWDRLLNPNRLGRVRYEGGVGTRTVFERDFDRIVFSSAFRRLQDKTQVFPLTHSDYVRTRLTHSLEASCVGRSLGTMVGERLMAGGSALARTCHPSDIGAIVATACLAHDIGNPPFGHAGENAIAHWFENDPKGQEVIDELGANSSEARDMLNFEGNAQGLRVLTRLQQPEDDGGLQLTYATLAAFVKYPNDVLGVSKGTSCHKKHGFFAADRETFEEVANATGLVPLTAPGTAFCRHPLAYLVEAADDICYHVIDLEDGYRMKLVSFDDVETLYRAVIHTPLDETRYAAMEGHPNSQISFLRAKAVGAVVAQTVEAFFAAEEQIMAGDLDESLTDRVERAQPFEQLKAVAASSVYPADDVVLIEAAGFNVLGQLIGLFLEAVNEQAGGAATAKSRTLLKLFPVQFYGKGRTDPGELSLYERVLAVTDFVAGMTDRYAVSMFKRLTGISLSAE